MRSFTNFTLFEKFLSYLRIRKIASYFNKNDCVLDIGCGQDIILYKIIKDRIKVYYGIDNCDFTLWANNAKFSFLQLDLERKTPLPISDKSFDKVILLAVLEHLNNFEFILKEGFRVLKDNGLLLITTPTPRAEKVLDFLAKLKIVNPETIRQHKTYFSHDHLREILINAGFKDSKIKIGLFEFGFNIFCMAQK